MPPEASYTQEQEYFLKREHSFKLNWAIIQWLHTYSGCRCSPAALLSAIMCVKPHVCISFTLMETSTLRQSLMSSFLLTPIIYHISQRDGSPLSYFPRNTVIHVKSSFIRCLGGTGFVRVSQKGTNALSDQLHALNFYWLINLDLIETAEPADDKTVCPVRVEIDWLWAWPISKIGRWSDYCPRLWL